jgi:multiple sugar transport system substrate-binding protein
LCEFNKNKRLAMKVITGLTWDHPRGTLPLKAWAKEDKRISIEWSVQKLEGFESHPIDELAARYDLLVVDNPGIGEAVVKGCIRALEDFLSPGELAFLQGSTIGNSYSSYQYKGKTWAIPIDAASQVCAVVEHAVPRIPDTWDEVMHLASSTPGSVALSLGGPHALLTFYSICLSLGAKLFSAPDSVVEPGAGLEALNIMQTVYGHQNRQLTDLNPIALLNEMSQRTFALCPAIFGYVNYSSAVAAQRVSFVDIPHAGDPGLRGAVLGGTGIALSTNCDPSPELIAHLMDYVSESVQRSLVVTSGGQPSNSNAWLDTEANVLTHNFFRNTFGTVSSAFVRPKYAGYIDQQNAASAKIREGLIGRRDIRNIYAELNNAFTPSGTAKHGTR